MEKPLSQLLPHTDWVARASQWRALGYFCLYRFLISGLLVALFWLQAFPSESVLRSSGLYVGVLYVYLSGAIVALCFFSLYQFYFNVQVFLHALLDIVCLGVLLHAHVGPNGGFGTLLIVAVAGSSLLTNWQSAVLTAALSSLVVLGGELYWAVGHPAFLPDYAHAGFLGLAFFACSVFGQLLAARVKDSEALSTQRAIALENLSQLNDYIGHRMSLGMLVLDERFVVQQCNRAAEEMLHITGGKGMHLGTVSVAIRRRLEEWREHGEGQSSLVHIAESGREVRLSFVNPNISPSYALLIFMEDMAAFKQHVQRVKLASLGRLTASIAHEIRNPLGAISNAGQLLLESSKLSKQDKELTSIVIGNTCRVNRIIENVLSISRRGDCIQEHIDLVTWLRDFVQLLQRDRDLDEGDVMFAGETESLMVRVDVSQLRQIVENLVENALRYSTRHHPRLHFYCGIWEDTERPWLDVEDWGGGIPEVMVENLFEPFVTTEQEGSGMGLYIARELCEANQANLVLHRNTRDGCCFRINFPLAVTNQVGGS